MPGKKDRQQPLSVVIAVDGYSQYDCRNFQDVESFTGKTAEQIANDWRQESAIKQTQMDSIPTPESYLIPSITHSVWLTPMDNAKQMNNKYISAYIHSSLRINKEDPNFKHYIWTNNPATIPKEIRDLPGVEIKHIDEFEGEALLDNVNQMIKEQELVQASDVVRVLAVKRDGGVYHDMDSEIYDAKKLIKYMKHFDHINGEERNLPYPNLGNAFLASIPNHPIVNALASAIYDNLNHPDMASKHAREPYSKVQEILSTTGPNAYTDVYLKYKAQHGDLDDRSIILRSEQIYNRNYVRAEQARQQSQNLYNLEAHIPMPKLLISGDPLSGGWTEGKEIAIAYHVELKLEQISIIELSDVLDREIDGEDINLSSLEVKKLFSWAYANNKKVLANQLWTGMTRGEISIDNSPEKALYFNIYHGDQDTLNTLLDIIDEKKLSINSKQLGNAIHFAAADGNKKAFDRLLEYSEQHNIIITQEQWSDILYNGLKQKQSAMMEKVLDKITDLSQLDVEKFNAPVPEQVKSLIRGRYKQLQESFIPTEIIPGYKRNSTESWEQEGFDQLATGESISQEELFSRISVNSFHNIENIEQRLESGVSLRDIAYKIPANTHSVWISSFQQTTANMKQIYIEKYKRSVERINLEDPNFKHYIWANNPVTIPDEIKNLPGVEVMDVSCFEGHKLMENVHQLITAKDYVKASDVIRILALDELGGVYHDFDYEIYDAKELIKYMKFSSFFNGEEQNYYTMGNAFIASRAKHPVMTEMIGVMDRNLNDPDERPEYVSHPYRDFDRTLIETGPRALTVSYIKYKIKNIDKSDDTLLLPRGVIYNKDYARSEYNRRTEASSQDIELVQPLWGVKYHGYTLSNIGADMASGGWSLNSRQKIPYYIDLDGKLQVARPEQVYNFAKKAIQTNDLKSLSNVVSYMTKEQFTSLIPYALECQNHIDIMRVMLSNMQNIERVGERNIVPINGLELQQVSHFYHDPNHASLRGANLAISDGKTGETGGNLQQIALVGAAASALAYGGKIVYDYYQNNFGKNASLEQIEKTKELLSQVIESKINTDKIYEDLNGYKAYLVNKLNDMYDKNMENTKEYEKFRDKLSQINKLKDDVFALEEGVERLKTAYQELDKPNVKEGYVQGLIEEQKNLSEILKRMDLQLDEIDQTIKQATKADRDALRMQDVIEQYKLDKMLSGMEDKSCKDGVSFGGSMASKKSHNRV